MVGQVLKITTVPMKYEINIEPARLEIRNEPQIPFADVKTTQPQLRVHSDYTRVNISTYEARKSLGYMNIDDFIKMQAARGKQNMLQKTGEAAELGWQISENYDKGVTIGDLVTQRLAQQPQLALDFLPKGGAQLSWEPAECDISYRPGNVQYRWEWPTTKYQYIPGSIDVKILQWPSVNVEYLGSPNYVPPSSAPDHQEQ